MSNLAEQFDTPTDGQPSDPRPGALHLELDVTDRDVIRVLERHKPERQRREYALVALRIGILALEHAAGQIDATAMRETGQELLADVRTLLEGRAKELNAQLDSALKQYFDPATGLLPQRIQALVQRDGELERILRAHIGPDDSVIAKTLAGHLGADSPVFRMLSPTQADGLKAQIEQVIEGALAEQRAHVLREFSLDSEESALSRLVKQIGTLQGDLKDTLGEQIQALVKEFSSDADGSALNRLTKALQRTTEEIGSHLTLDREDSALSRLKRELSQVIDGLVQGNTNFQAEVRATLAALQARREEARRTTTHGGSFEDEVGALLCAEAQKLGDVHTATGNSTGTIRNCKVGDHVIEFGAESPAPGARVVIEAKASRAYDLQDALAEMELGRKNRGAQIGIFVFASGYAPDGLQPFGRYGQDLVVLWDAENPTTDVYLKAAYSVARALVVRQEESAAEVEEIDRAVREIEKQAGYLDDILKWAGTIENNSEKIVRRAGLMQEELTEQIARLDLQLRALKSAVDEG
jgi:hypothetical protein